MCFKDNFLKFSMVKGTRLKHLFVPTKNDKLEISKVSLAAPSAVTTVNEIELFQSIESTDAGYFYVCIYEKEVFIWITKYVSNECNNVMIEFMHPKELVKHYF